MKQSFLIQVFLAVILLLNCGGGGGGGGDDDGGDSTDPSVTARLNLSDGSGFAPFYLTMSAADSSVTSGVITSYAWDFGDGTESEGVTASHIYTQAGTYKLTLKITGSTGKSGSASQTISVTTADKTFSLSGDISIMAGTEADGDMNDPYAPLTPNNDMAHAQEISNPAVVGGYVTLKNAGEKGALFDQGDESDFYKVTLSGNESISLYIADPQEADIDLYLYDASGVLLETSSDLSTTEFIQVSSKGVHYLDVKLFSGASNYVLIIGQHQGATAQAEALSLKGDFIPGEMIIEFADDKSPLGFKERIAWYERSTGLKMKSGAPGRPMLFTLRDPEEDTGRASDALSAEEAVSPSAKVGGAPPSPEMKKKLDTLLAVKTLRKRADVVSADLNYIRKPFSTTPDDASYRYQWHYPFLHLPQAWDVTTGDSDVVVAVVDTGVLVNHPDLSGKLVQGYDFIRDKDSALDGDGMDNDPDDPGDEAYGNSSSFHGTHVAGTIAAASNNQKGVSGIAWSAKIMPLRVLGKKGGTDYDIIQAIRYAAGLDNDSKTIPSKIADVINLSFGGPDYSKAAQKIYQQARDKGCIIVAAAGNESSSARSYPAAHEGILSVSAVDMRKKLASYSNYGTTYDKWIQVAAPGGDTSADVNGDGHSDGILSTGGNDASGSVKYGYYFMEGTSMATPHVSGVMALMKSVCPDLSPDDVQALLEGGEITENIGSDIYFGYGLIDAYLAVTKAQEIDGSGPITTSTATLVVSPETLNFDPTRSAIDISATNGGSGSLSVSKITTDEPWLTVTASSITSSKLGSYTVSINRSGLAPGSHTGAITLSSTANSVTIPVIMQVIAANSDGLNAGLQYLVLVPFDASPNEEFTAIPLLPTNSLYDFLLSNVEPGLYNLYTGTDNDNDGHICDWGEACGIYLTMSAPKLISVNSDFSALNFTTSFKAMIPESSLAGEYASKAFQSAIRPIKIRKEPVAADQ